METTEHQNRLMHHTCGLSNGESRNWFVTNPTSKDGVEFEKLINGGLAIKQAAPSWAGDKVIYSLTEKGKQIAKDTMPKPPKLTRGQKRYKRFLEYGDCFDSFIEFCRWDAEQNRKIKSAL